MMSFTEYLEEAAQPQASFTIGAYEQPYKNKDVVSLFVSNGSSIKCFSGQAGLSSLAKQLTDKKRFGSISPNTRFVNNNVKDNTRTVDSKKLFTAIDNLDFSNVNIYDNGTSLADKAITELLDHIELLALAK